MRALLEYRNGHYSGGLDNQLRRQDVGLLITDDCEVLLADWRDSAVHGKYYFTNGKQYAYGSMLAGKYDGTNVFVEHPWTVVAECTYGKLNGRVTISTQNGHVQSYIFRNGEKVQTLRTEQARSELVPELQYQLLIEDLLSRSDLLRMDRQTIGKVYYGTTNALGNANGLGFVLRSGRLCSAGRYVDGKQNGPGRCYYPNEVHDGTFKDDELHGVGCKWIASTNSYMFAEFRPHRYTVLSRGSGEFPSGPTRRIREEFHLRSTNYHNDWVLLRKIITVEVLSLVAAYSNLQLIIAAASSTLEPSLATHGEFVRMVDAISSLQSPTKLRSPSQLANKLYNTTPERKTEGKRRLSPLHQILQNSQNQVQQLRENSLQMCGRLRPSANDSLIAAIRQYEELKALKRRHRTPKRRRK